MSEISDERIDTLVAMLNNAIDKYESNCAIQQWLAPILAAERERTKKECMEALKTYYGTGHTMVDVVLARLERRIEEL